MKKILLMAMLVGGFYASHAQLSISINIGSQPAWGPVGYDYVEYYYIPDADAYYDVNDGVFVYYEGNGWRRGRSLPGRYSNIDLYHVHKVVINDRDPWVHNDRYRQQYRSYAGRHDQRVIRDAREQKYWENPGNRNHGNWNGSRGNGNPGRGHGNEGNHGHGNNGNGHGRGHGHGKGH